MSIVFFNSIHATRYFTGPWEMVLIVHGFPNQISALRFEWAWQHPKRSRRLNQVPAKKSRERVFDYNIRLLSEMLNVGPWNRLPLIVRWLKPEVKFVEFPSDRQPPLHMPIVRGPVKSKKVRKPSEQMENEDNLICSVCFEDVRTKDRLQCLSPKCAAVSHLECLAKHFLRGSERFLPVSGQCPVCDVDTLWGDLVRKRNGCYEGLQAKDGEEGESSQNCSFDEV